MPIEIRPHAAMATVQQRIITKKEVAMHCVIYQMRVKRIISTIYDPYYPDTILIFEKYWLE